MRNRPLCSVCLMVFLIFSIGMTAGGSRFFRELVPPEMKKQAGKEVQITGQVYQIEVRESYQILYLILSKKTSRILVYDDAKQPVQIGNKVNVKGELSLFEEARNPGNFDQKFYYEKQKMFILQSEDNYLQGVRHFIRTVSKTEYFTISFLSESYSTMQMEPGFSYPSLVSHSRETIYFLPFSS